MPLLLSLWSEQIVAGAFNLDPVRYTIFTTPQAAELFNKKCKIAANVVIWGDFDGEEREQSFIIVDTCDDGMETMTTKWNEIIAVNQHSNWSIKLNLYYV